MTPHPLDYGAPARRPPSVRPIVTVAMICGLCSGPVAFYGAAVMAYCRQETIAMMLLFAILGGSLSLSLAARPGPGSSKRDRLCGKIALASSIFWIISPFFIVVLTRL